jgi:hypothetical protein
MERARYIWVQLFVRATLWRERVVDEEGLALGVILLGPWFSLYHYFLCPYCEAPGCNFHSFFCGLCLKTLFRWESMSIVFPICYVSLP